MDKDFLEHMLKALREINLGKLDQRIDASDGDDPLFAQLAEEFNIFAQRVHEVNLFAISLSNGDLKTPTPKWDNYLAGGLKRLQANLMHLVWKLKQIEKGNYFQHIDFVGDISTSFNQMVLMLHKREDALKFQIEERKKLYELMLTIFDVIKDPIFIVDKESVILAYQNDNARLFFENMEPDVSFGLLSEFSALSDKDAGLKEMEYCIGARWFRVALNHFELLDERSGLLVVMTDITEWKVSQERLLLYANLDELSGALNRRAGFEAFETLIAQLQPPDTLYVCFIDINGLKTINDVYGHSEGDTLIKSISQVLLHNIRKKDIICRYGGDEFFLVFPDCSEEIVNAIMQRMLGDVEEYNATSNKPYQAGFSYGIQAVRAEDGLTAKEVLTMADQKMYKMKHRLKLKQNGQNTNQ